MNNIDKVLLNQIINKHKAQPVGKGYYWDIIVPRDNYKGFISDLVINKYTIAEISWWEYSSELGESQYGMGGPLYLYGNGWYSEMPIDTDEIAYSENINNIKIIEIVLMVIENKVITLHDQTLSFKDTISLTPAICIDI